MNVQTLKPVRKWGLGTSGLTPTMLNHAAWLTHDVAATADFYTRIMGMELASTIYDDHVPSTGEAFPYFHIFFRMGDGSTIAFFEVPGLPERAEPSHPAYRVFEHIALEAPDVEAVGRWKEWLVSNGVEVIGPVDHEEMLLSLYFYDPNGIRLEITTPTDAEWNSHTAQGYEDLEMWVAAKEKAVREHRNIPEALIELIREKKGR